MRTVTRRSTLLRSVAVVLSPVTPRSMRRGSRHGRVLDSTHYLLGDRIGVQR